MTATDPDPIATHAAPIAAGPEGGPRRANRWPRVGTGSVLSASLVAAGLFTFYAVFAVQRHRHLLTSGFDLGICPSPP